MKRKATGTTAALREAAAEGRAPTAREIARTTGATTDSVRAIARSLGIALAPTGSSPFRWDEEMRRELAARAVTSVSNEELAAQMGMCREALIRGLRSIIREQRG